jgi:tripartite-type tricarboxylate transporter receptor subunit TctC
VPSLAETLPGYESSAWFGLFGPARLPASTSQRLADAVRAAVQTPEVRQRIEGEGAQPGSSSPEEFARFVQAEIARWREVVVFSGAKPE